LSSVDVADHVLDLPRELWALVGVFCCLFCSDGTGTEQGRSGGNSHVGRTARPPNPARLSDKGRKHRYAGSVALSVAEGLCANGEGYRGRVRWVEFAVAAALGCCTRPHGVAPVARLVAGAWLAPPVRADKSIYVL